jgi:hypothetical protein
MAMSTTVIAGDAWTRARQHPGRREHEARGRRGRRRQPDQQVDPQRTPGGPLRAERPPPRGQGGDAREEQPSTHARHDDAVRHAQPSPLQRRGGHQDRGQAEDESDRRADERGERRRRAGRPRRGGRHHPPGEGAGHGGRVDRGRRLAADGEQQPQRRAVPVVARALQAPGPAAVRVVESPAEGGARVGGAGRDGVGRRDDEGEPRPAGVVDEVGAQPCGRRGGSGPAADPGRRGGVDARQQRRHEQVRHLGRGRVGRHVEREAGRGRVGAERGVGARRPLEPPQLLGERHRVVGRGGHRLAHEDAELHDDALRRRRVGGDERPRLVERARDHHRVQLGLERPQLGGGLLAPRARERPGDRPPGGAPAPGAPHEPHHVPDHGVAGVAGQVPQSAPRALGRLADPRHERVRGGRQPFHGIRAGHADRQVEAEAPGPPAADQRVPRARPERRAEQGRLGRRVEQRGGEQRRRGPARHPRRGPAPRLECLQRDEQRGARGPHLPGKRRRRAAERARGGVGRGTARTHYVARAPPANRTRPHRPVMAAGDAAAVRQAPGPPGGAAPRR